MQKILFQEQNGEKIMIELVKEKRLKGTWVGDMRDGDVGVIVVWRHDDYLGRIVQRYKNILITIGMCHNSAWSNCDTIPRDCRVRLLEKDELLIIT